MASRGVVSQCTLFINSRATTIPQALRHFPVVMLVNHLAWRNKFLMKSALWVGKRSKTHSWCSTGDASLSSNMERAGSTDVWFIRRNTKPMYRLLLQPSRESVGLSWLHPSVPVTQTHHCFSSSVSNRGLNFVAIHRMFNFPLKFAERIHMRGLTCQQSRKYYVVGFVEDCAKFLQDLFSAWPVEERPECPHLQRKCPHFRKEKTNHKSALSPWHFQWNLVWAFQVQFSGVWSSASFLKISWFFSNAGKLPREIYIARTSNIIRFFHKIS